MYANSSYALSPSSATLRPNAYARSSSSSVADELELFHNFIRWHASDQLIQPWGPKTRPARVDLAGRTVPQDRYSSSLVVVRPVGVHAVDICFMMQRGGGKRYAVHARVHIAQWGHDERHAVLTSEDVRAAAFRGLQTLLASPDLEPVEYVTSITRMESEEISNAPPHESNGHSLQWSMSM